MTYLTRNFTSRLALALIWLCWAAMHPATVSLSHAQNVQLVEVCSASGGEMRVVLRVIDTAHDHHAHGGHADCPLCLALAATFRFGIGAQSAPNSPPASFERLYLAAPDWVQPPTRAPPQA